MSKAYDRIEWCFVSKMMRKLGFPENLITLVSDFISTVTYQSLINGEPTSVVIPHRGLHQGDPLSSYLFIICAEGLSICLQKAVQNGYISGGVASSGGPRVSHLLFVNDSLLFYAANKTKTDCILGILKRYAMTSGQSVNLDKTGLFFSPNM